MTSLLFLLLSALTIGGALWTVLRKSPVDSVMGLLVTMVSLAGHYAMLQAPFLAAVQVIVYAGAVIILFLFIIMLLNLRRESLISRHLPKGRWRYAVGGALLMPALAGLFKAGNAWLSSSQPVDGSIEAVGLELFQRWVYPFELTGILLLAAMVGAIALTRKSPDEIRRQGAGEKPDA